MLDTQPPAMLVLDATDPPETWGADLEVAAHGVGTTVVYGAELPAGEVAVLRLRSASARHHGFHAEHGVAPLLDFIRSRVR